MSSILPIISEEMDLHPLYPISMDVCDTHNNLNMFKMSLFTLLYALAQKYKDIS